MLTKLGHKTAFIGKVGNDFFGKQREQTIMELRFGLNGTKEHTQREIAEKLGISRSYVSRIEKRAVGHMREAFYEPAGNTL